MRSLTGYNLRDFYVWSKRLKLVSNSELDCFDQILIADWLESNKMLSADWSKISKMVSSQRIAHSLYYDDRPGTMKNVFLKSILI